MVMEKKGEGKVFNNNYDKPESIVFLNKDFRDWDCVIQTKGEGQACK